MEYGRRCPCIWVGLPCSYLGKVGGGLPPSPLAGWIGATCRMMAAAVRLPRLSTTLTHHFWIGGGTRLQCATPPAWIDARPTHPVGLGGITPLFGLMRTRTLFGFLCDPRAPLRVGLDHGLSRLSRGNAATFSAGASARAWIGNLRLNYCGLTIGGQGAALLPGRARCNALPDAAASLDRG